MKKIMAATLLLMFAATAHSQTGTPGGQVRYEGSSLPGTITVSTTGFGKRKPESSKDALKNAFYTLLFRGIPGSQYELPMVADEQHKKNDPAIKALLGGGYTGYVTENILRTEEKKTKKDAGEKGILTTHQITINCDALRRHLESTGVIRKFGI